MERKCGNCAWLEKDDGFLYCLLADLYTEHDLDELSMSDEDAICPVLNIAGREYYTGVTDDGRK